MILPAHVGFSFCHELSRILKPLSSSHSNAESNRTNPAQCHRFTVRDPSGPKVHRLIAAVAVFFPTSREKQGKCREDKVLEVLAWEGSSHSFVILTLR